MPTRGSLLLEVFELGGEVVDWTVSSDDGHVRPYLIGPKNYEGQEIDPVSAAATIGTVDVGVIDPAQTPGQQQTGWMTERIGSIRGRRNRLRRYIDDLIGYVTIGDGPAGTPRLDPSYSAYSWPIRDTREIERRLQAFNAGASTAVLPRGPVDGFGLRPDDSLLLEPVTPLVGTYSVDSTTGIRRGIVTFDWDGAEPFPSLVVDADQEAAFASQADGARAIHTKADILWRLVGEDEWNIARPMWPVPFNTGFMAIANVQNAELDGEEVRAVRSVSLWLHEIGGVYSGAEPFGASDTEGVGELIEIIIRYRGPASDEFPFYYEGTAGELIADLYDGYLSGVDRLSAGEGVNLYDPAGLQLQALLLAGGGVRYDAEAVAAMTETVRLRQVKPVDDARDWAETHVYGPSGWIPALDDEAVISPVSRGRPSFVTGPLLTDAICEPTPDWNGGERVVTSIEINYERYFIGPHVELEPDGLAIQPVNLSYVDAEAEAAEGQHPVTYDGSAFSAVGDSAGQPLDGDIEPSALLAQLARYDVLGRYRAGAQAIRVRVRRQNVPALRIGEWCPVQLSWLPNTTTGLRGLELPAVQVLSIDDSETAWRYLLLEESSIVGPPGYFAEGEKVSDVAESGYFDSPELVSDEESP